MKKQDWFIPLVAIVALTILEVAAIIKGVDGALFSSVIAIIGGIAGYKISKLKVKK